MKGPTEIATIDRASIHFDTLWGEALARVQTLAGQTWTDYGEHDPGVTLLQALAFATSDLAYRHTLPLVDLLTPEGGDGAIFPARFAPEVALTTAPITAPDYRRALLDIVLPNTNDFGLRDAQLVRLSEEDSPHYAFDPISRTYSFHLNVDEANKANKDETREEHVVPVLGGYELLVAPERGVDDAVLPLLDSWVTDYQNLCERVERISLLEPFDVDLYVTVEVEDDWVDAEALLVEILHTCDEAMLPRPFRRRAADLFAEGVSSEALYDGPHLQHGWIPILPPGPDYRQERTLHLGGLTKSLLAIPGVFRLHEVRVGANPKWEVTIPERHFPRLWAGTSTTAVAQVLADRVVLLKRGQRIPPNPDHLAQLVNRHASLAERELEAPSYPFGRFRNPGAVHSASALLPPCYGLHNPNPNEEQRQLHRFMLPFEQMLADGCDQLGRLPSLLAFDADRPLDQPVWGGQWPFPGASLLSEEVEPPHDGYKEKLNTLIKAAQVDKDKQLDLVNYLLGYFGFERASRTLVIDHAEFLATQVGLLKDAARLGYERARFRNDTISSLERRIAARLGWGAELFNEDVNADDIPFYIVEHRSLLPTAPDPRRDDWQKVDSAKAGNHQSAAKLILILPSVEGVRPGQLIDLRIPPSGPIVEGIMIEQVAVGDKAILLDLGSHARLRGALASLLSPEVTLEWRNANAWLRQISYPLEYSSVSTEEPRIKVLKAKPFPLGTVANSTLVVEAFANDDATEMSQYCKAKILDVDRVGATITAQLEDGQWPQEDAHHWWTLDADTASVDRFSFAVSVVFRANTFKNVENPHAMVSWIEEAVAQELPLHIQPHVRWMGDSEFDVFAATYSTWQSLGAPLGDRSYDILRMLALGTLPVDYHGGIGAMRIANNGEPLAMGLIDGDGHYSDINDVRASQLLYIPNTNPS